MNIAIDAASIRKIENELQVTLPQIYQDTLLLYPFELESEIYNWSLFGDVDRIIAETRPAVNRISMGKSGPSIIGSLATMEREISIF